MLELHLKRFILRILLFIFYGLIFVQAPEITNLIIINKLPFIFVGSMIVYTILLGVGYVIQKIVDKLLKGFLYPNIFCIIFFGLAGLAFEWFVIGNSPWKNPDAIQWGMFVYWVGLFMIPRILVDKHEAVKGFAGKIKVFYLAYSIIHLFIALTLPAKILPFVIPLIWTFVYTGFAGFYIKYILLLQSQKTDNK